MKKLFVLTIYFICSLFIFAQTQGESLFIENRPEEAVVILENEILRGEISPNTYNFLGLGYYQLGEYEKSINAFSRGIKSHTGNDSVLYFNQGNAFYGLKEYLSASESYNNALKENSNFYSALLNKANSLLMGKKYKQAKDDYVSFLHNCPNDPQKENIEAIIKALTEEIDRLEEEQRLIAEANKPQWEQIDDALDSFSYASEKNQDKKEEWEEIEIIEECLNDEELEYLSMLDDKLEKSENLEGMSTEKSSLLNNLNGNLPGFGTMVTNNYNTYNENYYNSYGNSNSNEYEKNNNNYVEPKNTVKTEGTGNSQTNNENKELDSVLNEKRRQLAEAEQQKIAAQAELDKKREEHKKLSEEEQKRLKELAELEAKLEEYRKLAESEQQRLEELAALEKEQEANKNSMKIQETEVGENQESKNEELQKNKLKELAEYEKKLEEQRKALEAEQQRLNDLAKKQEENIKNQKILAEQERLKAEQDRLKAEEDLKKQKQSVPDNNISEEEMREQIRREMLEAEKKRRQQMLDDVANSLQKSSSTNMSSGAEDIIDYKFEGELD